MQAGVILLDYATLMIEILKDNTRPEAGKVYEAIEMDGAKLVGQIHASLRELNGAAIGSVCKAVLPNVPFWSLADILRCRRAMSALPPKADMCGAKSDVRLVPIADIEPFLDPKRLRF